MSESDEYEETVDVNLSEFLQSLSPEELEQAARSGGRLVARVKFRDGHRIEVSAEALTRLPDGIEIVRQWEYNDDPPSSAKRETPSRWSFYPWHIVVEIEYEKVWIAG